MADIAAQIKDLEVQINDGVILGRRDNDYVGSILPYNVRLIDGNWTKYISDGEKQYSDAGDSMSCVTFSALNVIETQEKFLTGTAPNYSDRWIAKQSGTTREGNYLWKVADTIRQVGLVWERDYPAPAGPWSFDEWMADIPASKGGELKILGEVWKRYWTISYEWLDLYNDPINNVLRALRQAPLQMVIPGHAVEAIYKPADIVTYFDTYQPFVKGKPLSQFVAALKIILNPLKGQRMTNAVLVKKGQEYGFYVPTINPSALISEALHYGIEIPKNPDGSVSFTEVDKMVGGQVTLWV
jgi:hypothetical protein